MSTTASQTSEFEGVPRDPPSGQDSPFLRHFRTLALAEALDERLLAEVHQGALEAWEPGGAESALVGAAGGLAATDWLFAGSRDLAAVLARGISLETVAAHAFATRFDRTKGRVHPMRLAVRGTVAASGFHNGAHLTHAAGAAWAAKIRKESVAVVALLDAAEIAGAEFHNALNFAGVFRLPVVFVAVRRDPAATATLSDHGVAYGLPSAHCDGDDPIAVAQTVGAAVARARRGEGATAIDAFGIAAPRTASKRFERANPQAGLESIVARVREECRTAVDQAVLRAKGEGAPPAESMFEDVFGGAALPWHLAEARAELGATPRGAR